jgi:cell division protein FtsL
MAERKVYDFDNEYNYDTVANEDYSYTGYNAYPYTQDDVELTPNAQPQNQTQEHVSPLPMNPRGKFSKISRYEKAVAMMILFVFVTFAVAQIYVSTKISVTTNQITTIQQEIQKKQDKITELKQQSNELQRAERVKKIAADRGLSVNQNNLRKVKVK